jgi:hypothetical protein
MDVLSKSKGPTLADRLHCSPPLVVQFALLIVYMLQRHRVGYVSRRSAEALISSRKVSSHMILGAIAVRSGRRYGTPQPTGAIPRTRLEPPAIDELWRTQNSPSAANVPSISLHPYLPFLLALLSPYSGITMKALAWVPGFLALVQLPVATAAPNCPLIGPEFPPPQHLAEHPIWRNAIANITSVFQYIDTSNITGVDKFSYAIQIFSTNPGKPVLWERYRTAKDLPKNTTGVTSVDGDTVFRLGSVTKVYTVLAFLAENGDVNWNQPITKFVPELASLPGNSAASGFDSVRQTAWEDITLGALASQVSGLGRDCKALTT